MSCDTILTQPSLSVPVNVTVYNPGCVYRWIGLASLENIPSPNSQYQEAIFVPELLNSAISHKQMVSSTIVKSMSGSVSTTIS